MIKASENSAELKNINLSLPEFYIVAQRLAPRIAKDAGFILFQTESGRAGYFNSLQHTFLEWCRLVTRACAIVVEKAPEVKLEEKEEGVLVRWFEREKTQWLN